MDGTSIGELNMLDDVDKIKASSNLDLSSNVRL
jgi:hypothetical protein